MIRTAETAALCIVLSRNEMSLAAAVIDDLSTLLQNACIELVYPDYTVQYDEMVTFSNRKFVIRKLGSARIQ